MGKTLGGYFFTHPVYWSTEKEVIERTIIKMLTHSDYCDVVAAQSDVRDGGFVADRPVEWRHLRSGDDVARHDDVTVARCRCDVSTRDYRPIWQITLSISTFLKSVRLASSDLFHQFWFKRSRPVDNKKKHKKRLQATVTASTYWKLRSVYSTARLYVGWHLTWSDYFD